MRSHHWIFSSLDHAETYARRNELLDGRAVMAYLSFPSLKNPHATRHTVEIIAKDWLTALDDFRNWLTWACGPRNAMKISAAE